MKPNIMQSCIAAGSMHPTSAETERPKEVLVRGRCRLGESCGFVGGGAWDAAEGGVLGVSKCEELVWKEKKHK